jgi:ABC-type uncharacterized transport system auxiliary subunit
VKLIWNRILPITALSILLVGCAGVKYPTYYTLNLSSVPDPPPPKTATSSVAIRQFRSVEYLRGGPIVYRSSPEQIGYYAYHRWAVDPRNVVTNSIAERLRAQGMFADVRLYDGHSDPDYILSGRLEKLEEIDDAKRVRVEVGLSAQLVDTRTGKTIWANSASESCGVDQRSVSAVVAEMSRTLDRAIQSLLSSLSIPPMQAAN